VRHWALHIVVAGSLALSAAWGACALCPDNQASPKAHHGCCDPPGTSTSTPSPDKQCPRHSLAANTYDGVESGSLQAPVAVAAILTLAELPVPVHNLLSMDIAPVVHAPPDLFLHNSVLLI
jgi:hypothetical protein